eukprot:bmy_01964T0
MKRERPQLQDCGSGSSHGACVPHEEERFQVQVTGFSSPKDDSDGLPVAPWPLRSVTVAIGMAFAVGKPTAIASRVCRHDRQLFTEKTGLRDKEQKTNPGSQLQEGNPGILAAEHDRQGEHPFLNLSEV